MPLADVDDKTCEACQEHLPRLAFKLHNRSQDGLSHICKRCSRRGAKRPGTRRALPTPEGITTKYCRGCEQDVSLNDFAPAVGGKYGRHSRCLACVRKSHHDHKDERNKARRIERQNDDWFQKYNQEYASTHRYIFRNYGMKARAGGFDWKTKYPDRARQSAQLQARKWRAKYPEKHKMRCAAATLRKRALSHLHTSDLRGLWEQQAGKCRWCSAVLKLDATTHLDHIIPLARGGDNRITNLCWVCKKCNLTKHDKMPHEFAGTLF